MEDGSKIMDNIKNKGEFGKFKWVVGYLWLCWVYVIVRVWKLWKFFVVICYCK